ncbi:MAG: phospho-N-acetylmuramoyl-pentapeptide-transferase [Candidatus Omnitrophica bacterium]|nr:phospho-N-acetylmuramoyl-pentapeptide-transferase [Candidatus Omnitrophota bacterium]
MLYHILFPLSKYFSVFNVTRYITFRGGCAFISAFLIVMFFWNFTLKRLKFLQLIEKIDMYGHVHLEALYQGKKGTPTMGGILILFAVIVSTLLWSRWDNYSMWLCVVVMLTLGIVGLRDDLLKTKSGKGLTRLEKLFYQILIGGLLGILILINRDLSTSLDFPFFKNLIIDLGFFYIAWAALVVISTSNAVNFTDGLDGLAIGTLITNALIFGFLCYLAGNAKFANYLFIPFVKEAGELTVLCLALVGAGLGFLWFNSYPAQVFMGDVGALALGGVLGAVALLIKKEFLLVVSGAVFVAEALSVILQIISVKILGKKLFKAAPLHHHFQLLGWKEPKIIVRFWIVSIICAVATLLTLKLR